MQFYLFQKPKASATYAWATDTCRQSVTRSRSLSRIFILSKPNQPTYQNVSLAPNQSQTRNISDAHFHAHAHASLTLRPPHGSRQELSVMHHDPVAETHAAFYYMNGKEMKRLWDAYCHS